MPVELHSGTNEIFVAGIRGGLKLSLEPAEDPITIASWASAPPLVNDRPPTWLFLDHSVAAWNCSTGWIGQLHVHYGAAIPATPRAKTWTGQWQCHGRVAPLALTARSVPFWTEDDVERVDTGELLWPVELWDDGPAGNDGREAAASHVFRVPVHAGPEAHNPGFPRGGAVGGALGPALDLEPLFLLPDRGEADEWQAALELARFLQQRLAYETGVVAEIVEREDLWTGLAGLLTGHDVVLFGNATIQSWWSHAGFERTGSRLARAELETRAGRREGAGIAVLHVRPKEPTERSRGSLGFVGFGDPVGARRLAAHLSFEGEAASAGSWIAPPPAPASTR